MKVISGRAAGRIGWILLGLFACIVGTLLIQPVNAAPPQEEPGKDSSMSDGVLWGRVINGTTGQPEVNINLTLRVLSTNGETKQAYTTISGEDGAFTFKNLSREYNLNYALEGDYLGVTYFSPEPVHFLPDAIETELNLTVYETTENPDAIAQSVLHRIISFDPKQIIVADVYAFSNKEDRTFIGQLNPDGRPETVKIGLPSEATDVVFHTDTVRPTDDGPYLDSQPILPGRDSYTLSVTYLIPYDGSKKRLETLLFYDVETIKVLAVDLGESISSPQLTLTDIKPIQGSDYQLLDGANLKAGQSLVMDFNQLDKIEFEVDSATPSASSVPASTPGGLNQIVLRWVILGLGVLAIGFSLVYAARRQPQAVEKTTLTQEKTRLLTLLSELETLYQAGELDEPTYQLVKQKNRALLRQILAQLHD